MAITVIGVERHLRKGEVVTRRYEVVGRATAFVVERKPRTTGAVAETKADVVMFCLFSLVA